jgi:hypothetical protein
MPAGHNQIAQWATVYFIFEYPPDSEHTILGSIDAPPE